MNSQLFEILKIDADVLKKTKVDYSNSQSQTESTFGYKWEKRDFYENEEIKILQRKWLIERYCKGDESLIGSWLEGGKKIILDAGCGAGYSSMVFWGDYLKDHFYLGVDISSAVDTAKQRFTEANLPGDFMRVSVTDIPIPDNSIDIIFCEGVLHHTDSTENSLNYLAKKLKKGGKFLFYVYAKKSPIREFTDDHIREYISKMTNDDAWNALMPLTLLGKALSELKTEIEVPEDIPYLGIKKGKIDVQRLFYWHICKMWYRPEANVNEMNLVNFDWFRPLNCHRHTKEEIESYCKNSGLKIEHLDTQESGFSVVATKN